jgi:Fibronectin type III domain
MPLLWLAVWLVFLLVVVLPVESPAQAPCTPTPIQTTSATIGWVGQPQPDGWTLTGYGVDWKAGAAPWEHRSEVSPTTQQYTERGLAVGTSYTWCVYAIAQDTAGKEHLSDCADYGTPQPCVTVLPPPAPRVTNLRVVPSCGAKCMLLAWDSPSPETLVELHWRLSTQPNWKSLGEPVMGTSLADDNLPAQKTVCYRACEPGTTVCTPAVCGTTGGKPREPPVVRRGRGGEGP